MKNTKHIIVFILSIVITVLCVYKIVNLTNYNFVKTRAVNYLCDKYDADKDEFELVDYKHSRLVIEDFQELFDVLQWYDFSFEFKFKDKNFFVNRYKGRFYDDYQIDDIEMWCTDWLKENVDTNISGVFLDSKNIAYYQHNTRKSNKYIVNQKDAEDFILNCYSKKTPTVISYYEKNISEKDYSKERDYIKSIINTKIDSKKEFQIYITSNTHLKRLVGKSSDYEDYWATVYSSLYQ